MGQSGYNRVVFETPIVKIGAFRCAREHAAFENSGPAQNDCIVFPRTAVAIEHDHERPFVSNPNVVNFYNRGDHYRRAAISEDGDRCDWFSLRRDIVVDIASSVDPAVDNRAEQPFASTHAPSDPRAYAWQRRLFIAASEDRAEPLAIEEAVVQMLERVLRSTRRARDRPAELSAPRRQRDLVDDAKLLLSREFVGAISLADLARALGVSVFHLCRVFRRLCGCTLHEYRQQLRLRSSLEQLVARRTVVDAALDAGFSSHSHYGSAFRKAFGQTPTDFVRPAFASPRATARRSR